MSIAFGREEMLGAADGEVKRRPSVIFRLSAREYT